MSLGFWLCLFIIKLYFQKDIFKCLEVKKKLNSLITKDYIFFLVKISFTSNGGSEKFVYQQQFIL